MAKQATIAAELTPDLFTGKRRVGRPPSGAAMSNKERQRKYRQRHKSVDLGETMTDTVKRLANEFDLTQDQVTRHLIRFALCNRNWSKTGFPESSR